LNPAPSALLKGHARRHGPAGHATALADGALHSHSGIVTNASAEDADGGFARYRLTVRPWVALLAHTRRSQVWQEQTLVRVIESVFARCATQAQWHRAGNVAMRLAQSPFLRTAATTRTFAG
jgi:type VI secretion system secreted protein VgrG